MDESGFNTFNNDGSFMEKFIKMQEEKKKEQESSPAPPKPAVPSLVKRKPLLMKMRGVKKAPTLVKSTKTISILEGNASDNDKKTQEDKTKGEILTVHPTVVVYAPPYAQLSWVCKFSTNRNRTWYSSG